MTGLTFLLRREVRAAAPWTLVFLVGWVIVVLKRDPGVRWPDSLANLAPPWFWIGYLLGGRDEREGTAAFLEALPISRVTHVLVRYLSAQLCLGLAVIIVFAAMTIELNADQLTVDIDEAVAAAARSSITAFVVLGCALSAGLGAVRLGVVAVSFPFVLLLAEDFLVDREVWPKRLQLTDLSTVVDIGGQLRQSDQALMGWGLMMLPLLGIVVFFSTRRRLTSRSGRWSVYWLHGVIGCFVAYGLYNRVVSLPATPVVVSTQHYDFILPAGTPKPDASHLATLDADFQTLAGWFGVNPDERLRADATGSLPGAHGKAAGRLIALDVDTGLKRSTVAHETAHVLASMVSNGAFNEVPEFDVLAEGLATHLAFRITDPGNATNPRLANLAPLTRIGILNDLHFVDAEAARAIGSRMTPYYTGTAVVEAISALYGNDAVFRVVRAAEAARLSELSGSALRQDLFGRAGLWWAPVLADARARVDAAIARTNGQDGTPASTAASEASPEATPPSTPDEQELSRDRRAPLPTASLRDGNLMISAARPDGRPFPSNDEIDCHFKSSHDEEDARRGCSIPLNRLAGTWADVRVRVGKNPVSPWLRIALPDRQILPLP